MAVGTAPPRVLGVVLAALVVAGAASGLAAAVAPARSDASARSRAVGYLLRGWLSVKKVAEIKRTVIDAAK